MTTNFVVHVKAVGLVEPSRQRFVESVFMQITVVGGSFESWSLWLP